MLAASCFASSRTALAIEPDVSSESAFQAYDMRSPTGQTVLERTRFTSTLGVSLYDILGEGSLRRDGPELSFRARVRYDADYGISGSSTDPTNNAQFIPGLADTAGTVDLMYAYLEGRRLLHGVVGFKLGRQYMVDSLGWWSFDGADVKATLPFFVAVEGYGGLEVRGGLPLSTPRFEAGGIWRGNRSSFDPSLYPQFQPADVAPAFGAAIESSGVTWLHSRLTYRRVYDTGSIGLAEFANANLPPGPTTNYSDARISTDKIGYAAEVDLRKVGEPSRQASRTTSTTSASRRSTATSTSSRPRRSPSASTTTITPPRSTPTRSGTSSAASRSTTSRCAGPTTRPLPVHLGRAAQRAHLRRVQTPPKPTRTNGSPNLRPRRMRCRSVLPDERPPLRRGGRPRRTYKWGEGNLGLRGAADFGDAGDRVGGDVSGQRVLEGRYILAGRLGVWQWDDKLRPDRDATNFGYMLGTGYRFAPRCQAMFEWQHDMNRLVGQRFRALLTLSVAIGE